MPFWLGQACALCGFAVICKPAEGHSVLEPRLLVVIAWKLQAEPPDSGSSAKHKRELFGKRDVVMELVVALCSFVVSLDK